MTTELAAAPSFALALRGLREARRLSMSDLARRLDCDPSYVSKLESGARMPSRETIDALIAEFRLTGINAERFLNLAGMTGQVWSELAWDVQRAMTERSEAA